ncbi:MAG: NUDIX domain-containing protein, partial [Verrucomicrobia bacterium]|nr:NUDIX domain-containing protein [Verrucomicrobiota bacterium]
KLLREEVPTWEAISAELGLNPKARAEELSLQQWTALTNQTSPMTPPLGTEALEEQFQVVDDQDRPIGGTPRSQVHANNSLHRAVHILIFNPGGDVYLQLRSRLKDRHPLTWDSSAAGHVNPGEDYGQTAVRELQEELGIETELERVAKVPASKRTGFEFIWLYRGSYEGELSPNSNEIEALRAFPPQIVDDWIKARPREFSPGFVECWKVWREKGT